jgi:hypothetical protein
MEDGKWKMENGRWKRNSPRSAKKKGEEGDGLYSLLPTRLCR